jgi:peptidoglycan/LPS O-acetylase OafA/YrhL
MLYIGMRYLDRDSKALRYGLSVSLPFFVVHQPVILAVAYFVVQWQATIAIKLLAVVLGASVLSIGVTELVIKRVGLLRVLFGMKLPPKAPSAQPQAAMPPSRPGTLPSP